MMAEHPRQNGKALLVRIIYLLTITITQTYSFTVRKEKQLEAVRAQAAAEWAPVIWLHPDEQFFPADAQSFIKRTTHQINGEEKFHSTSGRSGRSYGNVPITPLREGRASWDTYLLAPIDTDCPNCPIPQYLFGTRPSDQESPQVYAVINSCLPPKRQQRNRGRRTSHWNIINKHKIVSENDLLPKERNGSYTQKEMLINQNNSSEKINTSSEKIKLTKLSNTTIDRAKTDIRNTSSNTSSELVKIENLSNQSLTNNYSILISSHNGVSYNDTEIEINDNLEEQETNNSNNTSDTLINLSFETTSLNPTLNTADILNSTFSLGNKNTEDQLSMLLTRDKRVPLDTNIDIPTENTDTTMRTDVTDEAQARRITEDENINPQRLTHNDINQTLSSYNIPTQKQRFSVTYWMFYPYNHGKKVCSINLGWLGQLFKPRVNGVCHGKEIVMGNHVGDWEHVSIDFIDNTPKEMYISSHTFGAFYKYNPEKQLFYYAHQDTREGINLKINFPDIVYMDNNHPVLYTALGSHGLWSKPGVHQYNGLPLLYDVTASGDQWRTWENLDIIDLRNQDALTKPHRRWLGYEGRWGNPPKNCHPLLGGFCEQNHGPTGIPRKRMNFHCTR